MTPDKVVPNTPRPHKTVADPGVETNMVIALMSLISGGFTEGRKALAETAAHQCGVSAAYALAVLERYTGPTAGEHFWTVRRGIGGQHLYRLLSTN